MSSHKRIPSKQSTETTTATVEPLAVEPPAALTPPAADANPNSESFADRVGQRKWVSTPDPFGIASDNLAGVRLFESMQDRQMAIKFGDGTPKDKPPKPVIDKLKETGWAFDWDNRIWTYPVREESARTTRIESERLYQEVRQMLRQAKGIETGQEVPF